MRNIILLIALTSSTLVFSQGYRGKKFSLTYQPGYSMVNWMSAKFVHHHKLNIGFAVGKQLSLNLHGSFSGSGTSDFGIYEEGSFKDISGGISLLYFRKTFQCTAPVGRYMGLAFDYGSQNTKREVLVSEATSQWEVDEYEYYYDGETRETFMMISAIFGRNYLLKEKYIIGYGMQWGFGFNHSFSNRDIGQYHRHLCKPFVNLGIIF